MAPFPKLLGWLEPHWDRFRQLLVIKGRSWQEERDEAQGKLDHWDSEDAGLHAELAARVAWAEARIAAAGEIATTH